MQKKQPKPKSQNQLLQEICLNVEFILLGKIESGYYFYLSIFVLFTLLAINMIYFINKIYLHIKKTVCVERIGRLFSVSVQIEPIL